VLSLGFGAVIMGALLPAYKSPQILEASGPKLPFTAQRTYSIDLYLIPPIDEGSPIVLVLMSSRHGSTWVYLGPFDMQSESISGPPVVNEMLSRNETGLVVFGRAPKSSVYSLRITSWNSSYTIRVQSIWSPYFDLRCGTVIGAGLIPAALALLYYDRLVEERDRIFEEAMGKAKRASERLVRLTVESTFNLGPCYEFLDLLTGGY